MTGTGSFSHIPDIALITWHAEKNRSVVAAVSPWTKIVVLVLLVLLVTVITSFPALLLLYLAAFGACALARLQLEKIILWYSLPVLFVLSLVGILAWSEPGTAIFSFSVAGFTATLTDAGLLLIGMLLVKALIIVTYSMYRVKQQGN